MSRPAAALARPAGPPDVPALAALMVEFYAEAGFALAPQAAARPFRALLETPERGGAWLLEADGAPAGYVVLTTAFGMEYGGLRGFVDDLYVRAPFRGRGLAAAGLAAVREAALRQGLRALQVEVGADDEGAGRVYARAGFRGEGRRLLTLPLAPPVHAAEG